LDEPAGNRVYLTYERSEVNGSFEQAIISPCPVSASRRIAVALAKAYCQAYVILMN
jgi:hypothetical protein